ncbi:MAG: LacI family DNA-binding transcriptional regulator [Pseudomonadota bacterium]
MSSDKAPTLKDIADRLGLSPMTVSRAYRNHPNVNPMTKKRVMAAVYEMGYSPNSSARQLVKHKGGSNASESQG